MSLANKLSRKLRFRAGLIASSQKLRYVPSLPAWFRRKYESPKKWWPEFTREVPEELRSYAGSRRDPKEEEEAFKEEPLQDFLLSNPGGMVWLRGFMWRAMLPVSPRYWRVRLRAREADDRPTGPLGQLPSDELKRQLIERAKDLGLSALGVAKYDEKYIYEQWHGKEVGDRLVVCILEQSWGPTQEIPSSRSEQTALSTYAEAIDMVLKLAEFLKAQGYRAQVHDAAGRGMAIHFAVEAGLGQLGLNGQLLTPHAGSRCRIIMMSTNAPLECDAPRDFGIPKLCDACQICVRRCPPGAIPANRRVKRGVEKAPINTKRCFPIVGQAHGCAICMKVCPVQRYGLEAVFDEFERTGNVLGKGTDELEGYHWPLDGKHYGPGKKPRMDPSLTAPVDLPPIQLGRSHTARQVTKEEAERLRSWS